MVSHGFAKKKVGGFWWFRVLSGSFVASFSMYFEKGNLNALVLELCSISD